MMLLASFTCMVKLLFPTDVGVPLIVPEEAFRLRPEGNVPLVMDHVKGDLPPVTASVLL